MDWLSQMSECPAVVDARRRALYGSPKDSGLFALSVATVLATLVREICSTTEPEEILAQSRVRLRSRLLSADVGGLVAEVVAGPDVSVVNVDPRPTPTQSWQLGLIGAAGLERALRRSRAAHELAHLLLQSSSPSPPSRFRREWLAAEENFCDHFAAELLAGAASPPTSIGPFLSWLERRGLDFDTAAYALASRRGVAVSVGVFRSEGGAHDRRSTEYGPQLTESQAGILRRAVGTRLGTPGAATHRIPFVAIFGSNGGAMKIRFPSPFASVAA